MRPGKSSSPLPHRAGGVSAGAGFGAGRAVDPSIRLDHARMQDPSGRSVSRRGTGVSVAETTQNRLCRDTLPEEHDPEEAHATQVGAAPTQLRVLTL